MCHQLCLAPGQGELCTGLPHVNARLPSDSLSWGRCLNQLCFAPLISDIPRVLEKHFFKFRLDFHFFIIIIFGLSASGGHKEGHLASKWKKVW